MTSLGTLSFDTRLSAQAVKDADDIKKRVLQKIGKGITIGVKPDFKAKDIKSSLQSTLNSIKPKVKVDIIVDQATASKAVQQALAKAGLTNNMTAGQLRAQRAAEIQQRMALALARAQREAAAGADQHSKSLLTLNSHFGNGITIGGKFSATIASIYSVYTLKNFLQEMIQIGGEFQKQRIALETMLGSLSKADVMYKRMKELAVESPFTFMDLMSYTKQLKAFQIPYNELFETTKRLGDISAGLGVDMNRLILAYGQVRAASFLRGQEVRQFTEAGIPLIDALSKKFTELEGHLVSVGDVFDRISKRQVDFGMVKDVLWELTDEGGQFYNMQEKLTESLSGKLDKLKDSYQIMVAEMAQGNNAVLGGMLDTFTKLVQYGDKVIGMLGTLTGAYLAYKAALVAVNTVQAVQGFVNAMKLAAGLRNLAGAMQGLTAVTWRQVAAQTALNSVSAANWIALAVGAIGAAIGLYMTFNDETENLAKSTRELRAEIQEEFEAMNEAESKGQELIRTMLNESKATETRKAAYERLQALYPSMFKNMDFEQAKRKTNIELLQMETKAAREAMQAKLKERIIDAKARQAEAKREYEQYAKQNNEQSRGIRKSYGGERALKEFDENLRKVAERYDSINEELDELNKIQEEVNKRAENATSNRSAKWWNSAKKLAGEFAMYAPKEDTTLEEYQETIAKQLNSRKGFLKSISETAENYADVEKEVKTLENIYTAVGGKIEELSKYKTKSSGTDKVLKQWEADFSELQAFYQEFVKWAKSVGENEALKKLYESGLWGNLFKDDGTPKYDMRSWDKVVQAFRKENNVVGGTTERDKFVFKTKKAEIDFQYDINQKDLDRALNELNEYISKQSERYNLYKNLLEKTGNKDFAKAAFADGRIWDDAAREFESKLKEISGETSIDYTMTDAAAKKHFEGVKGGYELWKKIVEITSGNYVDALNKGADSMAGVMTTQEKILKIEQEIAELEEKREKATDQNVRKSLDAQISSKKKERNELDNKAFEENIDYVRFFGSVLSMSVDEAERLGIKLKEALVEKMKAGGIEANKFVKELKNIDSQLNKIKKNNAFEAFKSGGFQGLADRLYEIANDELTYSANVLETAKKELEKAQQNTANAQTPEERRTANIEEGNAQMNYTAAKIGHDNAVKNQKAAFQNQQSTTSFMSTVSAIAYIIQAMVSALEDTRKAAAAFGENLDAEMSDFGQYYIGILEGVNSGLSKLQQGDVAGAISSTLFGSIANIAQKHDATLKEDIEQSQRLAKTFENTMSLLSKKLESLMGTIDELRITEEDRNNLYNYIGVTNPDEQKALKDFLNNNGTIESNEKALVAIFKKSVGKFSDSLSEFEANTDTDKAVVKAIQSEKYFDMAYANLLIQRDQLMRQLSDEEGMKNKDEDKILDLKKQIAEMEIDIKNFAKDMAETLYGIDFKSWAEDLSDALVSAWAAGEDGAEAYKNKVSEILRDLGVKMITERFVMKALEPIMDRFINQYEADGGILTSQGMKIIAEMYDVGEELQNQANDFMDGINDIARERGVDLKDSDSSSSMSNTIKGITENTADLLVSYVNAIRADLSVIRMEQSVNLPLITAAVQRQSALAEIQVTHMQQVAANTLRSANAAEQIYSLFHSVAPDGQKIRI